MNLFYKLLINTTNKFMNIFERNANYELEKELDNETKARESLKQSEQNCHKHFKIKELLNTHQQHYKYCILKLTRQYTLFNNQI